LELNNCIYGKYSFLYVSPERLQTDIFMARVTQMPVKLLAVDEAHCISQWGYDFRPEYLKIGELRKLIPHVPVIAVTATATPAVADDIQIQLKFNQPNVYTSSFARENLQYIVLPEENKEQRLLSIIQKTPGSGIVYVRSRYQTQKIAEFLTKNRISATYYHAGLNHEQRSQRQTDWTTGKTRVIAATNAFGMGIDKPDVRFVVHMEPTDTTENYFQEAGRAGRDLQKAFCILLYNAADGREALEKFEQQRTSAEDAHRMMALLHSYYKVADGSGDGITFDFDIQQFASYASLHVNKVYNTVKTLEQQGIITLSENVFIPSKIKFTVNNYTLYEFQVKYPVLADFVKIILRSYGGAFEQYVPINENELAKRMGIAAADVKKGLEKLHQNEILDYQQQKDVPQLTFNFPRGIELIDAKAIDKRASLLLDKLKAVIQYAEQSEKCRQRVLLQYFGEEKTENCGKCDVCIELRKKIVSANEIEYYRGIIQTTLANGPVQIVVLAKQAGIQHQAKLADAIRKLTESGELEIKEGWVYPVTSVK
ncbi:MAG TPA: RecQ family ATP-dependent DNA helicase, partial [Bacteroidia bacterium]|nr:RecQ family ATP-dependent DNA helicase [Bacteroidia bacterium]